MRILLIEPAKAPITLGGEDISLFEPLALEYVAAGVVAEHEVRILDMRLDKNLQRTLSDFRPDIVGMTAYTVHVKTVIELSRKIKAWNPQVLTVVGGHHATVMPEDFLSPTIDLLVMGEGVFVFQEIVARLEGSKGFEDIPGVAYAKGDALVKSDMAPPLDLDSLPYPERRLTAQYRKGYFSEWMKPLASIRTSKGCPHRCNFCALWKLAGGRYFKREPKAIVEELSGIDEQCVFFADDESLVDVHRMETLAHLIKDAGIRKRFFLYGRSDTIAKNPQLLKLWKTVGLERVFVGLEFFRDDDLAYIRKGSTLGDNARAVKILQDLDVQIYASFIVRPEFEKADFKAFRQYCRDLGLNFAGFAVLTPLPGTDFYEEVRGQLITHDYDYFDFLHTLLPTRLPLKEFYEEYYQLSRKAVSPTKGLSLLRQFPLREIPSTLLKAYRFYSRLRNAYKDYPEDAGGYPGTQGT